MGVSMVRVGKKRMLSAIKGSAGIVSTIAKRLDVCWVTCKKLIDSKDIYQQCLREEVEKNIDKAESVILQALDEGDIQTAKWYLQTIGKQRGYSELSNINLSGNIKTDIQKLTDEELKKLRDKLNNINND